MITLFNNTTTTWKIESVKSNDRMKKIILDKGMKDNYYKSFQMILSSDITLPEDFTKLRKMESPQTVFANDTDVSFLKKTTVPMLVATQNDRYKRDIVIVNIKMFGAVLTNFTSIDRRSYILNYMIASDELIAVISTDDHTKGSFTLTFTNNKKHTVTTYTFAKNENTGVYVVTTSTTNYDATVDENGEETNVHMYKIRKYRPNRPTYLVCADIRDKAKVTSLRNLDPRKHFIVYAKDSTEARAHLENKFAEGYRSVTVFGGRNSFFGTYDDLMEYVTHKYKIVNTVNYDGKVYRK